MRRGRVDARARAGGGYSVQLSRPPCSPAGSLLSTASSWRPVTLTAPALGLAGRRRPPPPFGSALGLARALASAWRSRFFALRAPDSEHAAALSAMAQSVGYLLAGGRSVSLRPAPRRDHA